MLGLLGLLKGHQTRIVDKLSELVLASSSSGGDPFDSVSSLSDDGNSQFWTKEAQMILKKNNIVEKKLLSVFRFKKTRVLDHIEAEKETRDDDKPYCTNIRKEFDEVKTLKRLPTFSYTAKKGFLDNQNLDSQMIDMGD